MRVCTPCSVGDDGEVGDDGVVGVVAVDVDMDVDVDEGAVPITAFSQITHP